MDYFNLHTHYLPSTSDEIAIVDIDLHLHQFNFLEPMLYSAGIHPWFLMAENYQSLLEELDILLKNNKIIAIGEAGLDLLKGADINFQTQIFNEVVTLSETFQKPLIIHCVKAWEQLFMIHKQRKPKQKWIVHGFRGNATLAHQIIQHKIQLSFGINILNNKNLQQVFLLCPLDSLFLETDSKDIDIKHLYYCAAQIHSIDLELLKQTLYHNFKQIFYK